MNIINKIKNKIEERNIKRFFNHQRAKKGYCNKDLFDIGMWFLEIMPRMLDEYLKSAHGVSNVLIEDYINEHKVKDQLSNEEYDSLAKKWDEIIIEMRTCFLNALSKTCDYKNKFEDEYSKTLKEVKKDENIVKQYFEEDKKVSEYMEANRIKGMKLFTKYMNDLRD